MVNMVTETETRNKWHTMTADHAISSLESRKDGLKDQEAEIRLHKYGRNEIKEKKQDSAWLLMAAQFKSILVIILIFAGVVSFLLGEVIDGTVIVAIIIINAILGFYQEKKAEKALEALKKLASPQSVVLRNGEEKEIDSAMLVPGDIVVLESGSRVPADCRVIEENELKADESLLTGESLPVRKTAEPLVDVSLPDRKNMLFAGTSIVYGRCKAVVTETGMKTEFGKIAGKLQEKEEPTPLQRKLDALGRHLAIIIVIISIMVFVAGSLHGIEIFEMFLVAVALAVAAIPEGLPAIVTITLAIGLTRMAKKHAIMRRLSSVETLGSVTVICSDKTGTLTKNEMTVREVYVNGKEKTMDEVIRGKSEGAEILFNTGMLCNNSKDEIGDPTEKALIDSAKRYGLRDLRGEKKRISEIPFDSERKMMSVVYDVKGKFMFTKGAAEEVIKKCTKFLENGKTKKLTEKKKKEIIDANNKFTENALRVLAFAYKTAKSGKEKEKDLIFVGLQAMIDPPRPEVKEAIEKCETAGIRPVMITGDHLNTAKAIADELNIKGAAITGEDLDEMSDEEFENRVESIAVYARASPEHKVRITQALKKHGHIVAMGGDGINDAPALKKADIGIAVGSGTDVTKEAADMVLTDDNFAIIVDAVEEGRGIYDNIKKFVNYLLSANFAEILTIFVALMINLPLPLLPLHILWMNLLTDGLPALALGVEPPDKDVMERKPRNPKEKILNRETFKDILVVGVLGMIGVLFMFWMYLDNLPLARTMAFTSIVILELFVAVSFRSHMRISRIGFFSNMKLIAAIAVSFVLQIVVIYLPFFNVMFETVPIGIEEWIYIIIMSGMLFGVLEAMKGTEDWEGLWKRQR